MLLASEKGFLSEKISLRVQNKLFHSEIYL